MIQEYLEHSSQSLMFLFAGMSNSNSHKSFSLVATSNGRYSPRPFSALAVPNL